MNPDCVPVEAVCRMCRSSITLHIDKDYVEMRDPMGLVRLATCNRCYDYKVAKDRIERAVFVACGMLRDARRGKWKTLKEVEVETRKSLIEATRKYAYLVMEYRNYPELVWSEEFADMIMEQPDETYKAFEVYRQNCRVNAQRNPTLPYKDL